MIINKTEQKLKSIAIFFSVHKVIDWDDAVSQTMELMNTTSRDQAVTALGISIKELHD